MLSRRCGSSTPSATTARTAGHRLSPVRIPGVAGRGHHRAVLGAGPPGRRGSRAAGGAPPAWSPSRRARRNARIGNWPSICTTVRCRHCWPHGCSSTRSASASRPRLDVVYAALQDTAAGMRSTVTALHPQVLAQLGLTAAVRELLRQYGSRGEFPSTPTWRTSGRRPRRRCCTGRRANCSPTSASMRARPRSRVALSRRGDRMVLTVADDGTGFDPAIVENGRGGTHRPGVADGALRRDGRCDGDRLVTLGAGTTVTVTSPPEAGRALEKPLARNAAPPVASAR